MRTHAKGKAQSKSERENQEYKERNEESGRISMDVAAYLLAALAAIAFLLVGLFYSEHKIPAIILFGIGCLLITLAGCLYWIKAVLPVESEFHGVLVPANDPAPPNPCPEGPPADAIAVYMGSSVGYTTAQQPYGVLKLDDEVIVSIVKAGDGLSLNATIRSQDKRMVATIENNEFHINPNNYFYIKRPDRHTLIVRDQQNRECLNVRFLNPTAIKVLGVFEFPAANLPAIVIDDDKVLSTEGNVYRNFCIGEAEGAFWIESRPPPPQRQPSSD